MPKEHWEQFCGVATAAQRNPMSKSCELRTPDRYRVLTQENISIAPTAATTRSPHTYPGRKRYVVRSKSCMVTILVQQGPICGLSGALY